MCAASSTIALPSIRSLLAPICESSVSIVRTSLRRGRLVSVSGSAVNSEAHKIGSAAFFAPDTRTSPRNGAPPSTTSLSIWVRYAESVPELPSARQQCECNRCEQCSTHGNDSETKEGRSIGQTEKPIAKAVDHIKERVEMRHHLPNRRQRVNRIEHTGQKRKRHDDEILERSELIELVRPDAGDEAENAEDRAAEQRKGERPEWMRQIQQGRRKPDRHGEYAETHGNAADHRAENIRCEDLQRRQRRQQHENQVAGDLRLDQ